MFRSLPSTAVGAGFRLLARSRHAPGFHPYGLTCAGELEVVGDAGTGPAWGVDWLDTPRRYETVVRLSRGAGLPPGFPDALGLAVRAEDADGRGHPLDLLLTTSGAGLVARHLPRLRRGVLTGLYSSLLPYRIGGRDGVRNGGRNRLIAAFPRRAQGAGAPVLGDPESLRSALRAGPLVFDLRAAAYGELWRTFAVLTVRTPLDLPAGESPTYDVYAHDLPGFTPSGALASVRRAAYRGSRAGRGADPVGG